jgi:hypothetical protein
VLEIWEVTVREKPVPLKPAKAKTKFTLAAGVGGEGILVGKGGAVDGAGVISGNEDGAGVKVTEGDGVAGVVAGVPVDGIIDGVSLMAAFEVGMEVRMGAVFTPVYKNWLTEIQPA